MENWNAKSMVLSAITGKQKRITDLLKKSLQLSRNAYVSVEPVMHEYCRINSFAAKDSSGYPKYQWVLVN